MERNDIIRMAREAGFNTDHDLICIEGWEISPYMQRFAALVAAEKDKQIAKVMRTYEERAQAYLEIAKKMRDESRPDVLESERAANSKLTEELEKAELLVAEKDRQIAFLKDSHDAIRELAYKTGAAEEREATISKIESEICHAEINNLRLAPLFGQRHGPLAVRVDSLAAVVDAIRARGEA